MLKTVKEAFTEKEIRKRILFVIFIMAVYRLGSSIPVPGVNTSVLAAGISDNSVLAMMNMLGGGALEKLSVFAMGVNPYITASIIVQLLSMDVIPAWTEWAKSGEKGRRKLEKTTRYFSLILGFVQAWALVYGFDRQYSILESSKISSYLFTVVILTAGSMILLWLADQISTKGIGNGVSMIIFGGIVSNIPALLSQTWNVLVKGSTGGEAFNGIMQFALYLLFYLALTVFVVIMETATRRVPIQYANSGSSLTSNRNVTYLPIKLNSASVIPVIFAQSIITAPQIVISFFNQQLYTKLNTMISLTSALGLTVYAVLILLFTFFYVDLQMDTHEIADNLKKSNAFIPGIRAGKDTETYLHKVIHRITSIGAVSLMILAILPYLLAKVTNISTITGIGGTGIILIVGIALETIGQIRSAETKKNYSGVGLYGSK